MIPREIRKLFKKKSKYSKILYKVKTNNRSRKVTQKLIEVEKELRDREYKRKNEKESEAFSKMKTNPNFFYTYTKKLRNSNSRIGTLVDDNKIPIDKPTEEILQDQYRKMWNEPIENFKITDPSSFFRDSINDEPNEILYKIRFTKDKVEKSLRKIEINASAGPDGVPGILLNKLAEQLAEPLVKIYSDSMNSGEFLWKINSQFQD